MARLFGTDGIRGLANRDLTAPLALDLAMAGARVLSAQSPRERPLAVVGRDPRASGEFLSAAVVAGIAATGVDVWDVGVVPTPAVAFLTHDSDADFGVVLSASHNPMPDNGIKFFARGGLKLPDDVEDRIETALADPQPGPTGRDVGRVRSGGDPIGRYVRHVVGTVTEDLSGLRVVVDGANGAASVAGPEVLRELGADVIEIHTGPDGYNINDNCGSTHLDDLRAAVLSEGAHVGIANDGDADRCLAVDADGNVVDGDQIMAVLAIGMKQSGRLRHNTVVATVMSNLGFRLAMSANDINVVETAVGDRYVLEEMLRADYVLGGEQSGHVLMLEHSTTGDGVLTAAHLLARMAAAGQPLAQLSAVMKRLPQVLVNVPGVDKSAVGSNAAVQTAVKAAEDRLGDAGRVLLRPSGTEPLIRVMVEAESHDEAEQIAADLAGVVQQHLSL
ncbi:MAG: phosphoglucosamine mutase [Candidatus Nanopelagicales bacterium]